MSELEYFLSVENIEISLYAQARQSLLLLTQGNIYDRLRFLNKYLVFLEELNELFGENRSKFLTTGYLRSFLKTVPGCRVYRHVELRLVSFCLTGQAKASKITPKSDGLFVLNKTDLYVNYTWH